MLGAISIYDDVVFQINKTQNGDLNYEDFNAISWQAQLALLNWLTTPFTGEQPPELVALQKKRDWISFLITQQTYQVSGGKITRPDDYYGYENLFKIGGSFTSECEEDEDEESNDNVPVENCNTPIKLLSNDKFDSRCTTYIKSLRPSFKKPIAKQVGKTFEFAPGDIGSITLGYLRLPKKAFIATTTDTVYNELVPDPANTIDFEWGEEVRPALVYFLIDIFSNRTREQAIKQFNAASGKKS